MLDMDKVVIYGLGKEYSQLKAYLENNYDVIALCDKKNMGGGGCDYPIRIIIFGV